MRLRSLQYDKMTALRQENREAPLIEQDTSLWRFQPEEVMDESTATILDAHVAQLERELSILIYDIQDLENQGRGSQMRQLFVLLPKRLQEWEFFTQACLFAFPENHAVRVRMELALLEAYTELLVALNGYTTDETKGSVERWQSMLLPFTTGLTQVLESHEALSDGDKERLSLVKQRSTVGQ